MNSFVLAPPDARVSPSRNFVAATFSAVRPQKGTSRTATPETSLKSVTQGDGGVIVTRHPESIAEKAGVRLAPLHSACPCRILPSADNRKHQYNSLSFLDGESSDFFGLTYKLNCWDC